MGNFLKKYLETHQNYGISDLSRMAIIDYVIIHNKSFELILTEDFWKKSQPQNAPVVPIQNTPPFIDFGLIVLATGHIELTIRISVVMQPFNFSFLIGCKVQISKSAWIRTSFDLDISDVILNVSAHLCNIRATFLSNLLYLQLSLISLLL